MNAVSKIPTRECWSAMMLMKKSMGLMPELDPVAMITGMAGASSPAIGWIGHFFIGTIFWGIGSLVTDRVRRDGNLQNVHQQVLGRLCPSPWMGAGHCATEPRIDGTDQSGRFAEPCRTRARCATAFARLPHTAMLHQRRAWPLLTSRNHRVQVGPSHLRTRVKSFWQTRSPIASAIGNRSASGFRQRRLARQRNARCPPPMFSPRSPGGAISICR